MLLYCRKYKTPIDTRNFTIDWQVEIEHTYTTLLSNLFMLLVWQYCNAGFWYWQSIALCFKVDCSINSAFSKKLKYLFWNIMVGHCPFSNQTMLVTNCISLLHWFIMTCIIIIIIVMSVPSLSMLFNCYWSLHPIEALTLCTCVRYASCSS